VNGCPIACGQPVCDHQVQFFRYEQPKPPPIEALPLLEPDGPVWQITTLEAQP
jgi:hypothetical protein